MILKINDQEFKIGTGPTYHLTVTPEEATVLILRLQAIAKDRHGPRGTIELPVNTIPGNEWSSYWLKTGQDFLPLTEEPTDE